MGMLAWIKNLKFRGGGVAEGIPAQWVGEVTTDRDDDVLRITLGSRSSAIGVEIDTDENPLGISLGAVGRPDL